MRSSWGLLFALFGVGACGFQSGATSTGDDGSDGGGSDGSGSQGSNVPPCATFSAQTDTCQITFGSAVTLTGSLTFDTTDGSLKKADGTAVDAPHMTITTKTGMAEAIYAHDITLMENTT
ncbi:MAG TPA: hypothetical protein VGC42_19875, partial [Kofleriaceae bacterium]